MAVHRSFFVHHAITAIAAGRCSGADRLCLAPTQQAQLQTPLQPPDGSSPPIRNPLRFTFDRPYALSAALHAPVWRKASIWPRSLARRQWAALIEGFRARKLTIDK